MKVHVDQVLCETAGICVQRCPEVFRFQEGSKKATAIEGEVPKVLDERCFEVAAACPTGAIKIDLS